VEGVSVNFEKDSEYKRMFDDDEEDEEFMEKVYKKELGEDLVSVNGGVATGEARWSPKPPMSPFEG
jgi:hypothetical protein